MLSVAFFGLGVMGGGMAGRLLEQGIPLTVWNRRRDRADALAARGARVADSPGRAAEGADVLMSMVADDGASRAVWLGENGALAHARPGAILIESSTLSPDWIAELGAAAAARGCTLLDAPVTGSKPHAASGQLLFLVGGPAGALDRARPILAAMSRDVLHVGPAGSGATLKLVNNFLCGVQAAALAEAIVFIERAGMNRDMALSVLANGAPGSPLVKAVAPRMTEGTDDVNFALELMHKDLAYARAAGAMVGVSLTTAAAAQTRFASAMAAGAGHKDFSAVVEAVRSPA